MVWRQGRVGRDLIQHRMTLGSLAFGSGQSWNIRQTSQRHHKIPGGACAVAQGRSNLSSELSVCENSVGAMILLLNRWAERWRGSSRA